MPRAVFLVPPCDPACRLLSELRVSSSRPPPLADDDLLARPPPPAKGVLQCIDGKLGHDESDAEWPHPVHRARKFWVLIDEAAQQLGALEKTRAKDTEGVLSLLDNQ